MSADDHTNQSPSRHAAADHAPVQGYEIRVSGRLGSRWSTWFAGMSLTSENDGTSVIRGTVVDQAALYGLLQKLRDLGITLISLTPIAPETSTEHTNPTRSQTSNHTQHHSLGATS